MKFIYEKAMAPSQDSQHLYRINKRVNACLPVESSDDLISRSWKRCLDNYQLDPAKRDSVRVLTKAELVDFINPIEGFLNVAKVGISQLHRRVSDCGYVVLLTDRNGITVDYRGSDVLDRELRAARLYLGADWNEQYNGTCGVGTCIAEQKAITCHKTDHFDVRNITLTCTAAPIFAPEGGLLAVLDVSALRSPDEKKSQLLLLQMVKMHARMIESANFLHHFDRDWILRFGNERDFVEVNAEHMLAINEGGVIVGVNHSARSFLIPDLDRRAGNGAESPVGRHITEYFDCVVDDMIGVTVRIDAGARSDSRVMPLVSNRTRELVFAVVRKPLKRTITQRAPTPSRELNPANDVFSRLAGNCPKMQRVVARARQLVNKRVNVLVRGETGTGKELLARALHDASARHSGPFIAVNCSAIPEALIESELFGYRPGTFTGARNKGMRGLIVESSGGTLFLDEIGDMPVNLQSRLLRVLSEGEVMPLGASQPTRVDLNVISATHRDLDEMARNGQFREDLYFRLNGATLNLPALRERADKSRIIDNLLKLESADLEAPIAIESTAMRALLTCSWPGNIRQLRNALRYAIAMCAGDRIELSDLPDEVRVKDQDGRGELIAALASGRKSEAMPAFEVRQDLPEEISTMVMTLRRYRWNVTTAARELGVCRATIYRAMKRYGILPPNAMC